MESQLPTTEQLNERSHALDNLKTLDMLQLMNDEDMRVAVAVKQVLPAIATATDCIAKALNAGGRLIYIGAGTSGRLGVLDASECYPTFGVTANQVFGIIAGGLSALTTAIEGAEDDDEAGVLSVITADVMPRDVVVGISASGGAPFVCAAIAEARRRGATTVGISNSLGSTLGACVDIPIEVIVGPEVIQGSTRLKSGSAQKMVLNMLSTGAMVKIGKTYGNRMVDVQCTNAKLKNRAERLLRELGRVDDSAQVAHLIASANGSVKVAIVMARCTVTAKEAAHLLDDAGGKLSAVIDS